MLYEISKELGAALKKKGVPFPVVYGPERAVSTVMIPQRIVVERDRQAGDSFGPARAPGGNPRPRAVRTIAGVIHIYAQSTLAGASVHDHERLADQVADKIFVALDGIFRGARKTLWTAQSGKLLNANELQMQGLESWSGVVYELRFTFDRGVEDTTWKGEARPEVIFGPGGVALTSTTKVSAAGHPAPGSGGGGPPAGAETSCACGGNP